MRKAVKFLIFLAILLLLVAPAFSLAAPGLVPCTNTPNADGSFAPNDKCDFNALMAMVNKVINFILFDLAVPIAAIMFFYAGFLLVTAGGEAAGARTKAKSIFTNALLGLVFAAAAWLIVNTVLSILGYNGSWVGFLP